MVALHRHDGASVIQSSNRFNSGASGGGLFDEQGRLVGILTFRLRGAEAHYFAAPAEWVRQMLDEPARGAFRAVMPIEPSRVPYWQQPLSTQPPFLKAAALERDGRWAELAEVTRAWLHEDASDAEAWEFHAAALARTEGAAASRAALFCALRLEPARRSARRRLAALPTDASAPADDAPAAACPAANRQDRP